MMRKLALVGLIVLAHVGVAGMGVAVHTAHADSGPAAQAAQPAQAPPASPAAGGATGTSVAPAAPQEQPAKAVEPLVTYAGRVDGGAAAIAISVQNGQGLSYVCDGKRLEAWLKGGAGDGQLALSDAKGATLTGTYDGKVAAGTVTVGGRTYTFRIPMVAAPAGLYKIADKVANAAVQGGWVVYDGGQTGTVTVNGEPRTAPPLDTTTGEVVIDGVTVKPTRT